MQKPFAVIGFSLLIAFVAAVFIGKTPSFVMAGVCLAAVIAAVVILKIKGKSIRDFIIVSAALFSASLAFFVFGISYDGKAENFDFLDGKAASISGRLMEYPEREYGRYYYEIEVESVSIGGEEIKTENFRTRLGSFYPIYIDLYDYLYANVTFYTFNDEDFFSAKTRNLSQNVVIGASVKDRTAYSVKAEKSGLDYYLKRIHKDLTKNVSAMMAPELSGLVNAMILGDNSGITDEVSRSFRETGLSHLLTVSGFHVSVISGFLILLLSGLGFSRKVRNSLAILAVLLFMLLNGMSGAVMRSGIMTVIFLLADIFGREANSLNSLGLSLVIICLFNPFIGGDVGFLMSVMATAGIILLNAPIRKALVKPFGSGKIYRIMNPLASALSMSLAATVFLLPFQIYLFGTVSIIAPLASTLFMPLATLLIYLAIFALLFSSSGILAFIATPFAFLTALTAKGIIEGADMLSGLRGIYLHIGNRYGFLCLAAILLLLAVIIIKKPGRKTKIIFAACSAAIIIAGVSLNYLKYHNAVAVAVVNEGEESCVLILKNDEAAVITLGGYNETAAASVLAENNISAVKTMNLLSNTHDVTYAARNVLEEYSVETVNISEQVFIDNKLDALLKHAERRVFEEISVYNAVDGIPIEVIDGGFESEIFGSRLIIETGEAAGHSEILVTNNPASSVISSFTVLQISDIIEAEEYHGAFVAACERRVTYIDLFKDGKLELRRES